MERKYQVLITSRSFGKKTDEPLKILNENDCDVIFRRGPLEKKDMDEALKGIDAVIIGSDKLNSDTIQAANRLKVIAMHGVGTDGVDIKAADREGVLFTNVPGTNSRAVADLAIGLMICLARNIVEIHNKTVAGTWENYMGTSVYDKCIGILGLGTIGKEVAKRAHGFNMQIKAFDVVQDEYFADQWGVKFCEMDEIFETADFISVHLPLTDETRGFIDYKKLETMKNSAFIVNLSRGGIIKENDLSKALDDEIIAGAATDVFEKEPPAADNPLFKSKNTIVTPHIGGRVEEAVTETSIRAARNVVYGLTGEWDKADAVNKPEKIKRS
jgi:D-3-phosphoglycerate dehydrogenase